ncbi:MAG: Tfp pilus tip-associated adhesin PilY1 [Planctomycetota bacterium]|jgi:Tfp pilus tip-associated adhesin PilY1
MRYFSIIQKNTRLQAFLTTLLLTVCAGIPQTYADFDPVNDDTDIFLSNPNVPAQRPNILIFLDNTANWNTAFDNEKSALVGVVNNLSDQFNVGLLMFPETGGDNDSIDGAYIRFAVRQMTNANKTVLSNLVNGLNKIADKGNNASPAQGMIEIHRYLSGGTSRAGHGKVKTDYASNTDEPGGHPATNAGLGGHALPASPTASSTYTSPIADSCQSNFMIYISNGPAGENASGLSVAEADLAAQGYDTSSVIGLTPSGQQGNWMDEWAKYMANADVSPLGGSQNLTSYVVEVDPGLTGQGPNMTALMESVALNGNGEYFAVSSGNAGTAIVNALNQIFTEIQAVNSVFASSTLPVSVNVRGTNLNQVYIGVFRPDENKSPRWFGNLKMYQLGFNTSTSTLFLSDAAGGEAENPETGFINSSAPSFWTTASTYWSYRTADENGAGGSSDLPDGDLVEKGGAAQNLRLDFAATQAGRDLYTCTGACTDGSSLSSTPFATTNTDITNVALGLGSTAVSPLTGFVTQTGLAITDTFTVTSASTSTGGLTTTLSTDAVGQTITALSSSNSTVITAANDGSISQSFDGLNRATGNPKNPVEATINGHGYSTGTVVTIAGVSASEYNGTFSIIKVDNNVFKYDTGNSNPANSPIFASATATTTSSILTVTAPGHGLTDPGTDGNITLTGIAPTDYNATYSSWSVIGDNISITLASPLASITSFASARIIGGASVVAMATVPSHGYSTNNSVIINGATQTGYNGTRTITVIDANRFRFPVASLIAADNSGTAKAFVGNATVTATATAHGFTNGQVVTIAGTVDTGYGGAFAISNATANTFEYTTLARPANTGSPVTVAAGVTTTASAVIPGHKFVVGDNVDFSGATPTDYNQTTANIDTVVGDTVTYSVAPATPTAATSPFIVKRTLPTAYATLTGHGYLSLGQITIQGADQGGYNKSDAIITVLDADNFRYLIPANVNADATGTITASIKTTTATARAVAHGFATSDVVSIAGASPTAFNGASLTITKIDDDTFTYTLPSAQGDASGSILAASGTGSASARSNLIEWVRGADNFEDENADTTVSSPYDIRTSSHGDVLHSRPAVVNYNRHGNDDDVYIFYGANDGIFRGVKGGFNQSLALQPLPGHEDWGFIPEEFFGSLQRLRNNEPTISSSNKKAYFADGTIGVLVEDNSGPGGATTPDEKLDTSVDNNANPDRVFLYVSMRRGGRFIYALDVSDPSDPKLLWKKSNADTGFGELGQTWSAPRVLSLAIDTDGAGLLDDDDVEDVVMFGAGYDPTVEDIDPTTITAVSSSTVTVGASTYSRTMGRGIFVVDAVTGTPIWQAGPALPAGGLPAHPYVAVVGMDYAIPSDIAVITDANGSIDNRAYVGDTGGNIWRVDMADTNVSNWTVTKLASVADVDGTPALAEGMRKFLFPPDVVYSADGYDAVLIGSGDREHPFDSEVENRFYMFKDTGTSPEADIDTTEDNDAGTTTAAPANQPTIVESDLFDATFNCLQDASACATDPGVNDTNGDLVVDQADAEAIIAAGRGWYITLGNGEKVVGNAVTLNAVTFFNTNQPESTADVTDCSSNLGIARQYKVVFDNATAIADENIDGSTDAADRSNVHAGGGYLPSPVPVVVKIDGKVHVGIISGVAVDEPPGTLLDARLRKFWYKEIE